MLKRIFPVLLTVLLCSLFNGIQASPLPAAGDTIYVDINASGANDGSSWINAYKDLQNAISSQPDNKIFLIAKGTYYPANTTTPTATFALKNGQQLFGGFPTGGADFSLRNAKTNVTILSGDLNQNNVPDNGLDAYTIITLNALTGTSVIDGFTITGADNTGAQGGGIAILSTSATVTNNIIERNIADDGAGIYLASFLPTTTNIFKNAIRYNISVTFFGSGRGGAIYVDGACNLYSNLIYKNNSDQAAVNVFDGGYDIYVVNNTIAVNYGSIKGVIYKKSSGTIEFNNNVIWNNEFTWNDAPGNYTLPDSNLTRNNITPVFQHNNKRGNINLNPLFTDTLNNDFSLKQCSPAIEKADASLLAAMTSDTLDFNGNSRFVDNDYNGSPLLNIGALEGFEVCEPCTTNIGGNDQTCGFAYNLTADTPGFNRTGTWTLISGPGTAVFVNANTNNTQVNVNKQGSYVFRWTMTGNGCTIAKEVTITFYAPPIAEAGNPQSICGKTTTLAAVNSTGSGTWSSTTMGVTFGNNTLTNSTVTVTNFGPTTVYWTETNGVCPASVDSVKITFFNQSAANAGVDSLACSTSTSMKAFPSFGIGTWTKVAGPGIAVFVDTHDPKSVVNVSQYGTYTFRWSEVNGACPATTDNVNITFKVQPVANAGQNIDTCGLEAQLKAFPSVGAGKWTMISGPTGGTISFPGGTNNPNTKAIASKIGQYTLRWSEDNGPTCSISTSDIIVLYTPATQANLSYLDDRYCGVNDPISLGVNIPTGFAPYTFIIESTYRTDTITTSNNYYLYSDLGTTKGASQVTFKISKFTDGSGCSASFGNNIIVIPRKGTDLLPNSGGFSVDNDTLCNTNTAIFKLNYGNNEDLIFYIEDIRHGSVTPINYQGGIVTVPFANLEYGENKFRISSVLRSNGLCEMGIKGTSEITVAYKPVQFSMTKGDITCFNAKDGSLVLSDQVGRVDWTEATINGVADAGLLADNFKFGLDAGIQNVKVTNSAGCFFTRSATLTQPPQITYTAKIVNPTCHGFSNGTVEISTGGGSGSLTIHYRDLAAPGAFKFITQKAGTYPLRITDNGNGCILFADSVVLTEPDTLTVISTSVDVNCDGTDNGNITIEPQGGTSKYTAMVTRGSFQVSVPEFNPSAVVGGLKQGIYQVKVIDSKGCIAIVQDTISEGVELSFTAVKVKDKDCASGGKIQITVPSDIPGTLYSIDNTIFNSTLIYDDLQPGQYTIYGKTEAGCIRAYQFTIADKFVPLVVTPSVVKEVTCHNGNDGKIKLTVVGGSGVYNVLLDAVNKGQTFEFDNQTPGNHQIVFVDLDCPATLFKEVVLNNPPTYFDSIAEVKAPSCSYSKDGVFRIIPKGGNLGNFQYSINNGVSYQFGNQFLNLQGGTYQIRTKDSKGCESSPTTYTLQTPPALVLNVVAVSDFVNRTADVTLTAGGGTPGYLYSKTGNTFEASNFFDNVPFDYVIFTVKDSKLCIDTQKVALGDVGIFTNGAEQGLKLYPNPTSGMVTIEGDNLKIEEITVVNALGQRVMILNAKQIENGKIDLTNLEKGLYQLLIKTERSVAVMPVELTH